MNVLAVPFNPAQRGLHAVYRAGETNHCPGCGRTHWFIGRTMAECGFCHAALPLEAALMGQAAAPTITYRGKPVERAKRIGLERVRGRKGG